MGMAHCCPQDPWPVFSFNSAGSCFKVRGKTPGAAAAPGSMDLDGLTQSMKPAFALLLSADGIGLLHRAPDGWRDVATTPFDTEDLPAALAGMRANALLLEPSGIHSKLVLPDDQIRYLSLETGNIPADERIEAARQALDGATPYPVDELAFDICAQDKVTHVAAVALETLDEAETFAAEHGFGPVSFVAAPQDSDFQGEPCFGTTRLIRGTEVEPDSAVVKAIGPAQLPAATAGDVSKEEATVSARPDLQASQARQEPQDAKLEPSHPEPKPAAVPPAPPATSGQAAAPKPETPSDTTNEKPETAAAAIQPAAPPSPAPLIAGPASSEKSGPVKQLGTASPALANDEAGQQRTIPPAPAALRAHAPAASALSPQADPGHQPMPSGKPRTYGLALAAAVLLSLAAVSGWAVFGEDGFLAGRKDADRNLSAAPDVVAGDASPDESASPAPAQSDTQAEEIAPQVSVLADQPDPVSGDADGTGMEPTIEDEAAADGVDPPEKGTDTAFLDPEALQPGATKIRTADPQDELAQAARYAATGIWPVAPEPDTIPTATGLDELYTASVDSTEIAADAVALPKAETFAGDEAPGVIASPAPASSTFDLDERGLVRATQEGAINPDGITVYLGRPAKVPPPAPGRRDPAAAALEEEAVRNQVLSRKRPKARPTDFAEQVERAQNGGFSRAELASLRPRKRPASLKPAENELPVTAQAVASSVVPRNRPANFANLVDRARRNSQNQTQTQTAAAVPAAAAAAAPRIPTSASVARRATVNNALNLRKLNLIGVYGTAANRRALVRLPSGRYKKLQVGDRIDGGRVIAIGEGQLQYQKGGRNRTLTMPKG